MRREFMTFLGGAVCCLIGKALNAVSFGRTIPDWLSTATDQAMGIRDRPMSFRSPWQNGHVERLIGSARHECTDHGIVFNEEHLRRILSKYAAIIMKCGPAFRLGRMRPTRARSSGSGTLSRNRSLAGYTIDTCESEFSEGTGVFLHPFTLFAARRIPDGHGRGNDRGTVLPGLSPYLDNDLRGGAIAYDRNGDDRSSRFASGAPTRRRNV
jgi:hypothetical protein